MINRVLLLHVVFVTLATSEPLCSKYSYEEQLLSKMVRVEFKLEQLEEKISKEREHVLQELKAIKEERTAIQKKDLDTKEIATQPFVYFIARNLTNHNLDADETAILKTIIANEGNGYNASTGIFTAPVSGLYIFTAQICASSSRSRRILGMEIVMDETVLAKWKFPQTDTKFSLSTIPSCIAMVTMSVTQTGARIKVRASEGSSIWLNDDVDANTFSGVLIHKQTN